MNISSSTASALQRPDPQQMREAMFKKADADGSGGISKDELTAMVKNGPKLSDGASDAQGPDVDELFAKIDTDGDGEISKAENDTAMDAMQKNGPPPPPPDGAGFSGATDKLNSLLDALDDSDEDDSDSTTTSSSTSAATTTTAAETAQEELAKLVEKLAAQLKQDGEATSLFKTTA